MTTKLQVEEFIKQSNGKTIIDVRSPGEYGHARIPGAINCYLFDDEERAKVGTAYKQQGREVAMMLGLEYYGKNMQRIITQIKSAGDPKELYVHCWRGGMRSGVVSWMLDLFGYTVFTLEKGYKAFRHLMLENFLKKYYFIILGGRTGAGKTTVLHQMKNAQVIDLEGLAHHKGSAFGALGETVTTTQEQFENELGLQLLMSDPGLPIWLEDESQNIGRVNIPNGIWEQMRNTEVIYLDIPFEIRLENLLMTYGQCNMEDLKNATLRIKKRLGGLQTQTTLQLLEENNLREAFAILLHYYDKYYDRGLAHREATSIRKVESDAILAEKNADMILSFYKTHGKN